MTTIKPIVLQVLGLQSDLFQVLLHQLISAGNNSPHLCSFVILMFMIQYSSYTKYQYYLSQAQGVKLIFFPSFLGFWFPSWKGWVELAIYNSICDSVESLVQGDIFEIERARGEKERGGESGLLVCTDFLDREVETTFSLSFLLVCSYSFGWVFFVYLWQYQASL